MSTAGSSNLHRGDATVFIAIAIAAAAVHIVALLYMRAPPSPDAAEYLALGKSLAVNHELVLPTGERAKRMPAYPWFISLFSHAQSEEKLQDDVLAAQCVIAIAVSVMLAVIAWRIADRRAAILAGLTSALYAPHLYLQTLCLSEMLLIFFLAIALACYIASLTAKGPAMWLTLTFAALSLAAASLTRANAAVLAFPFAVDALLRAGQMRVRITRAVVIVVPLSLALIAWGLRNQREIGKFTLSTIGGLNYYLGHNDKYAADPGLANANYGAFDRLRREKGVSEVEADEMLFARGREFMKEHPREELVNFFRKTVVYHESAVTSAAPTLLLLIFPAILLVRRPPASRGRKLALQLARVALVITAILWIAEFWQTNRPWITPSTLLPIGLVGLIFLKDRLRLRFLFISLYILEMFVAIAFIPLARLRWTVDFLLILAIAVAVSRICAWLETRPAESTAPSAAS